MSSHPELFESALADHGAGKIEDAEIKYRDVLHRHPNHAPTLQLLAMIAADRADHATAIELTRRAIAAQPGVRDYHNNLGVFLAADHQYERAVDAYNAAIRVDGMYAGAISNLGAALKELDRIDEAIGACRMAVRMTPEHAPAHINLANALLVAGQLEEGFCEYEWRLRIPPAGATPRTPSFEQPRWDGSALNSRTILLHAEQGFGDTIQFARFATQVARTNPQATVLLSVQPQLLTLFSHVDGVKRVFAWDAPLPAFDVHCPLMSVPYAIGLSRETQIVELSREPYVRAEARLAMQWLARIRNEVSSAAAKLKIGLCWTGRAEQSHNRARSVPVSQLSMLAQLNDRVQWFSLQKPAVRMLEAEKATLDLSMIDWTDDLLDFADTAALIENLDAVVTVDTSIAHLAGAMQKPTCVLLAHVPDWRYGLHRADNPWYANMQLLRQQTRGDWTAPLAAIADRLAGASGR